jgi:hypothetical protein
MGSFFIFRAFTILKFGKLKASILDMENNKFHYRDKKKYLQKTAIKIIKSLKAKSS